MAQSLQMLTPACQMETDLLLSDVHDTLPGLRLVACCEFAPDPARWLRLGSCSCLLSFLLGFNFCAVLQLGSLICIRRQLQAIHGGSSVIEPVEHKEHDWQ